ncbi:hypothetical protein [Defluviitalea raffinosedens]|uniref:hypothetical protein n=1 Tax=Defluviitalea raffinosedens TaxID=1450156 RepID=UPI001956809B|nr:hypothetical protein [Defluviitalea raffinosedens]MBM7685916.1 hypothetical protein [Defluviitalea raffinosedens]
MRKSLLACLLIVTMLLCSTNIFAATPESLRIPESHSINGILPDGASIYKADPHSSIIRPQILLGYEYVPGYEKIANKSINYTYGYIYGTSVQFTKGASPTYTLTVTKKTTKSTTWNISGNLEGSFDIKAVKSKIQVAGGYASSETAEITKGETWNCGFTETGLYDLTWYMRGHKYDAFCGAKIRSTGADDGKFTTYYLGTVTFPTDEIHFDVTKVK